MAEVYGTIGDQQVELNNAASEATLKALLAVAKAQFEKQTGGKNTKAYKDLEKNLKSLVNQSQNFSRAVAKSTVEIDKKTQSVRAARKAYEKQSGSMKKFAFGALKVTSALLNAAAGVNQMASQISRMGSSMSSATAVLRSIPFAGDALSAGLGAIASAVESTQQAFIDAASVGANFGGSMESMIDHATNAGLTIDQFSQIIRNNGENLAFLASSTSEGAKRLSLLASTMRKSGVQDQLAYLGFSLEDINTGMASFSGMLAKGGINIRGMANERLVELTSNYMSNLDAVSKLTGQNRKELEKQRQERQRDSQVRILERKLDVDSRNRLNSTFDVVGPEISKGLKDLFMGFIQSPEAQDLAAFQGEAAQLAVQMGESMRRTGKLSTQSVDQLVQALANGAKKISDSDLVNVLGGPLAERYGNFVVANMDLERLRGKTLTDIEKEIQNELAVRKASGKEADPAAIMRTQQDLAKASNQATEFLVKQTGILTSALDLMSSAVRHTIGYLNDLIDAGRKSGFIQKAIDIGASVYDAIQRGMAEFVLTVTNFGRRIMNIPKNIYNGITQGLKYLFNSIVDIGKRLGLAFLSIMPVSIQNMFKGEQEKKRERLASDKTIVEESIAQIQERIAKLQSGKQSPAQKAEIGRQQKYLALHQKKLEDNAAETAEFEAKFAPLSEEQQALFAQIPVYTPDPPTAPTPDQKKADTAPTPDQKKADTAQTQATDNNTAATAQQAKLVENVAEQAKLDAKIAAARLKKNTEAEQDNTKATKDNTVTVKAASSCELDYSSPQALFNSFAKIMVGGKPGATDTMTGASAASTPQQLASMTEALSLTGGAGRISSGYGMRDLGGGLRMHKGVDIAAAEGTDVVAPEGGTARLKVQRNAQGNMTGYGNYIEILNEQKQVVHRLAHLSSAIMKEGEEIEITAGQVIGKVGNTGTSTGAHLHYEYLVNGKQVDPQLFFNQQAELAKLSPNEKSTTATPSATLSAVVTPTESQAAAAVVPEAAAGGTTTNTPGAGAAEAGNTSSANAMSSQLDILNTTVAQLVAFTNESNDIARQQLSAIKNNSSNLYT